jgi:secondary thiamine-phosphate synthase enzyme
MITCDSIELATLGHNDMHDLTRTVGQLVAERQLANGLVTVFTSSSTSALTTIEYESGALDDLRAALERWAPEGYDYHHNLRWGDGNGHSHLRAALLGPSLSIPVIDGQLGLGTWQQILFIDFDVRPRQRHILVQMIGDTV